MTDIMASPYKLAKDSPSRQLLWELSQIAISDQRDFYAHLDKENDERGAVHRQALAEAAAQHNRVRRNAEQYREKLELQVQAERRKREEEAQRELEKQRQEKVAQEEAAEKREFARLKRVEEERRATEAKQRAENEASEKQRAAKAQQDQEDAHRRQEEQINAAKQKQQAEAAEARAKEAAIAAQKARVALVTQPSSDRTSSSTQSNQYPRNPQYEEEHGRYLVIHRRLKDLRRDMKTEADQNSRLKSAMSDMRREIRKSVGQIREKKGNNNNKDQLTNITKTLKEAAKCSEPAIDITMLLAHPPAGIDSSQGPALLVYLLNIFAKAIIAQLITEAGMKPQLADQIGTIASHVFSNAAFRWQSISLIDIFIAKLHLVCPVLFGINGNEHYQHGKERLGWWKEEPNGPFIPVQAHLQRMTGLGAGFAALSLRNYENAVAVNPFPPDNYWRALARISNVPPNEISQTHFIVLKGLIEASEERFLQFYGDAATTALRHALIELPKRSPPSVASKQLAGLVDILKRKLNLSL